MKIFLMIEFWILTLSTIVFIPIWGKTIRMYFNKKFITSKHKILAITILATWLVSNVVFMKALIPN